MMSYNLGDRHKCAFGTCECAANGRPITFHASARGENGMELQERLCRDMGMYADVETLNDARECAAAWFANDYRVESVSIRESHQPLPGLEWNPGRAIETINRPMGTGPVVYAVQVLTPLGEWLTVRATDGESPAHFENETAANEYRNQFTRRNPARQYRVKRY